MPAAFAIVAHPDDIEFLMAGTMLLLGEAGYQLHYMTVADGCCGSTQHDAATIAAIRRSESVSAAQAMGAIFHDSLCPDLEIFYDRPTLLRLSSIVRQVDPEIVLTHAPHDYMEDHMNTCRLAVTASFARQMSNFPVEPQQPALNSPVAVYHAQPYPNRDPLNQPVRPNLFVDVTSVEETKIGLLSCHRSQKEWLDESQGIDSYLEAMRGLDREVGAMSGRFEYAEGWRQHLHLGFGPADWNPLRDALPSDKVLDEGQNLS